MVENLCDAAPQTNPDEPALDPEEEARLDARIKAAIETAKNHGYYYSVLGEQEKIDYVVARAHDDEDEIALLRTQIKATLALDPYNFSVFVRLVSLLDRMRKSRREASMHVDKDEQIRKAVETAFTGLGLPLELTRDGFPRRSAAPALAPA